MYKKLFKCYVILLILLIAQPVFSQAYNESNDFSYALKLYNEGFYDIAAQQFSTFINRYPGSDRQGDARFYYADALQKIGNLDDARIEFQGLAVSMPEHKRAPEAWYRAGECYLLQGNLAEAAKAFETVKILYPSDPQAPPALLAAARAYLQDHQLNRAEQAIKEFLDRYIESSEYPAGRILFARVLLEKNEPERAGVEFRRIREISQDPTFLAEALLGEARVYQQLGLLNRAVELLKQTVVDYPNQQAAREATRQLAEIYLDKRDYPAALALLGKALDRYRDQKDQQIFKMMRAQTYFGKGDYSLARKEIEPLLDQNEDGAAQNTLRFYYASCLVESGQAEAAYQEFQKLNRQAGATLTELRPAILINLTRIAGQTGRYSESRQYLQELERLLRPGIVTEKLHAGFIETVLSAGELGLAEAELQRFLALYPASPLRDDLLFQTAKAYFKAGNYLQASSLFNRIVEQYLCAADYDSSLLYRDFIRSYHQQGRQTGVTELARLLGRLLTGADREQLLFDLGKIYLDDLKDYQEASHIFAAYVENAPDSGRAGEGWYYLSKSQLRQAEYQRFLHPQNTPGYETLLATLKRAVSYAAYTPAPDSLTFWFLTRTIAHEAIPAPKLVQFWEHFLKTYPDSRLSYPVQLELAAAYLAAGDSSNAVRLWTVLSQQRQNIVLAGDAYWRLANYYQQNGDLSQSEEILKTYLLEIKTHPDQAEAYLRLAHAAESRGEYGTAAQFYERILSRFDYAPAADIAREQVINAYIRAGQLDNALKKIQVILAQYPETSDRIAAHFLVAPQPSLYFYAGKAFASSGKHPQARQYLLTFLNRAASPEHVNEALYLLGRMAEQEDDPESALLQYALVKPAPSDSFFYQANKNRADILFKSGKYSEAVAILTTLIDMAPDAAQKQDLEALKIRCMINQGAATQAAVKAFSKTYKGTPSLPNHLASFEYERGRVAFTKKKFDPAIKYFKTVMKRYKETDYYDDAHFMLGQAYATLNKPEEAIKVFREFQEKHPDSPLLSNVHLSLARIHFREEDQDAGLEETRKAVETAVDAPSRKAALSLLINAYKQIGLWDGALNSAREYVRLFPNAQDAVNKKISIGNAMIRLNRYQEAIDYFKKLKFEVSSREEPEIQFYIGEAYYNSGQYQTAINEFMKIPLLSQKTKLQWEASALYFAGQSYEKLGRSQEAIRMYQQIVDRPGIQLEFKRQARQLIDKLKKLN